MFSALTEWEDTLKELRTQVDTMRENCVNFQMPDPRFDGIEAVVADVEETKKMWNTYKE